LQENVKVFVFNFWRKKIFLKKKINKSMIVFRKKCLSYKSLLSNPDLPLNEALKPNEEAQRRGLITVVMPLKQALYDCLWKKSIGMLDLRLYF
jgi:hypothetical protein